MKSGAGPTASYTKNQHYVWRHYLSAWCTGKKLWCYLQRKRCCIPTTPKSIASETYFYEVHRLTTGDMNFLNSIVERATDPALRQLNRDYIRLNQMSFVLRDRMENANIPSEAKVALARELRIAEKTLGEHYHTGLENKSAPFLRALLNQDLTFYEDAQKAGDFFYFICNQYFRTARMRHALAAVPRPVPGHDPRRTGNVECHIYATNVGASLVRERRAYRITFLINGTKTPFITGDQPIINLLDPNTTDDLELYYPLSPALSVILCKDAEKFPNQNRRVSELEVERYNHAIFEHSEDQLYGNDEVYLRQLAEIEKHLS